MAAEKTVGDTAEERATQPPRRVPVYVRDQAMSTFLLDTLEELAGDAFAAEALPWALSPAELVAAVAQRGADVLLFDLWWEQAQVLALLDALRADDPTTRVPVVALATSEEEAARARSSYNVREALLGSVCKALSGRDGIVRTIRPTRRTKAASCPGSARRAGARSIWPGTVNPMPANLGESLQTLPSARGPRRAARGCSPRPGVAAVARRAPA